MALVECPECGQQISDKTKACVHCGVAVKLCEECGKLLFADAAQCPYCGVEFEQISIEKEAELAKNTPIEEFDEIEQEGLRELSILRAKWKQQGEVWGKVNKAASIVNIVGSILLLIILGIWVGLLSKGYYGDYTLWGAMSRLVHFLWIAAGLDFIEKILKAVSELVTENSHSRDLQALGREKYLSYIKGHSLKSDGDELVFYNQVETAAMPLEVSQERGKRTFSTIWALFIHIISFVWLLVFIAVLVVNMYQNNIPGPLETFKMFFDEMLGITLFGIGIFGCWISSAIIKSKEPKRQLEWRRTLRSESEQ